MATEEDKRRAAAIYRIMHEPSLMELYEQWVVSGAGALEDSIVAYIAMYLCDDGLPEFKFAKTPGAAVEAPALALAAYTCSPNPDLVAEQCAEVEATTFVYDPEMVDATARAEVALNVAARMLPAGQDLPVAAVLLAAPLEGGRMQLNFMFVKGVPGGLMWDVLRLGAPAGVLGL